MTVNGIHLLLAFGITAFALLIIKLAAYFVHFREMLCYIKRQIKHAGDDAARVRLWQKRLRCHYLCLIPFVCASNAETVYNALYGNGTRYRPKAAESSGSCGIIHLLAPSVMGIFACLICLCSISWAQFTASLQSSASTIKTPDYSISVTVTDNSDSKELTGTDHVYSLIQGHSYTVSLISSGTRKATGYCIIQLNESALYTKQLASGDEMTVTILADTDCSLSLIPKWGTCALDVPRISGGDIPQG